MTGGPPEKRGRRRERAKRSAPAGEDLIAALGLDHPGRPPGRAEQTVLVAKVPPDGTKGGGEPDLARGRRVWDERLVCELEVGGEAGVPSSQPQIRRPLPPAVAVDCSERAGGQRTLVKEMSSADDGLKA